MKGGMESGVVNDTIDIVPTVECGQFMMSPASCLIRSKDGTTNVVVAPWYVDGLVLGLVLSERGRSILSKELERVDVLLDGGLGGSRDIHAPTTFDERHPTLELGDAVDDGIPNGLLVARIRNDVHGSIS